jgi:hypothetical protein
MKYIVYIILYIFYRYHTQREIVASRARKLLASSFVMRHTYSIQLLLWYIYMCIHAQGGGRGRAYLATLLINISSAFRFSVFSAPVVPFGLIPNFDRPSRSSRASVGRQQDRAAGDTDNCRSRISDLGTR